MNEVVANVDVICSQMVDRVLRDANRVGIVAHNWNFSEV